MNLQNIGVNTGQAIGDFLYCSATKFNALFKININTGEMQFLGHFPKEDFSSWVLFRESYVYKNNIVFIPQIATGIAVYNVETEEFKRIELEEQVVCEACVVENILWVFPIFGKEKIWKINLDNFEVEMYDNIFEWKDIVVQRVIYYNNNFWGANIGTNEVLKIDISTLEINRIKLDCPKINTLAQAKSGLWIITENNKEVINWYPETGKLSKNILDIEEYKNEQLYIDIIDTEKKTFAIPIEKTPILFLDEEKKIFKKASEYPLDFQILTKEISPFFICRVYTKKGWCVLPSNANYMIFIGNEISYISPYFCDLKSKKIIEENYRSNLKNRIIKENIDITLSEYLELIQ